MDSVSWWMAVPALTHTDAIAPDDVCVKGDDSSFAPPASQWLVAGDRAANDVASGAAAIRDGASDPPMHDSNTSASAEEASNVTRGWIEWRPLMVALSGRMFAIRRVEVSDAAPDTADLRPAGSDVASNIRQPRRSGNHERSLSLHLGGLRCEQAPEAVSRQSLATLGAAPSR